MSSVPVDRMSKRVNDLTPQRRELVERMLQQRTRRAGLPPIPRRPETSDAPLSYAQQRMWLLEQLARGTAAHNMDTLVHVHAAFNVPALQRALNEIVQRHESLRTTFHERSGEPRQVIASRLDLRLRVTDLRYLPDVERFDAGVQLATADARQPFDLEAGPLVRASLYRLDDAEYLLLLTMHHIISDFVSMTVLFDELIAIYEAQAAGLAARLDDVPLQYADFACWQRASADDERINSQLAYWRTRLADLQPLELLTDKVRPAIGSSAGATYSMTLPADVVRGIRELSTTAGTTVFTTCLTAFKVLLHRHTRCDDIVVGVPTAGRGRPELQRVIGFFVNSLVMRTDLSGDPTFHECVNRVERTVAEALAHQDVPFEKLVEDLQPERRLNQNPLFQIAFQLLPLPKSLEIADRIWIDRQTSAIDLAVELIDSPDGVTVRADYATSVFHAHTIERVMHQYATLLRGIAAAPERRISEFELMGDAEKQALLNDWSRSCVSSNADLLPAHLMIAGQARSTPSAVAIELPDGSRHSYEELDRAAERIAGRLRRAGARPHDVVAVAVPPSFDLYASLIAVMKAGVAYVPVDVSQPEGRIEALLREAHPSAILTTSALAPVWAGEARVIVADDRLEECGASAVAVSLSDAAYVIFTSGSTGRPKGVVVEHGSLANQLRWMGDAFPLTQSDCVLQKYPIAFDAAAVEIFGTLAAGARLVPVDRAVLLDSSRLVEMMRRHGVTVLDAVPSLLAAILDEPRALRGIRRVIAGGEVLSIDLLERLRAAGVDEIVNMYGPTEATITATAWIDDGRANMGRVPIGRPIRNTVAYVLDERMQPVPVGVPGELYLGGAGIARGYLDAATATEVAFVANPFADRDAPRLYKTGDLVRFLPDRNLDYLGRTDRQVKIRGYRVAPEEIEAVLGEHSGVRECAVVHDRRDGDRLTACVVARSEVPELWPSVGEYGIYDDLLYHAMTSDAARNRAYQSAIDQSVRDKVVLDLGTGADLVWARACVAAGARHVFAVEVLPEAAARATAEAAALNLSDRVTVVQSDSRDLTLPEPVDVIVSELIGTIASSEGAVPTLNDARRLLAPGGRMIPLRAATRIAAVELPAGLADYPTFTAVSSHYVRRIFDRLGGPADARLCVKGIRRQHLLSDDALFESLDFTRAIEPESRNTFELTITRHGHLHGFLLWVQVWPGGEQTIDTLDGEYSWLPVFVAVDDMSARVRPGDRVVGSTAALYPNGQPYPDYRIDGLMVRAGAPDVPFHLALDYAPGSFRKQPFYQALFRDDGGSRSDGLTSEAALRAWLAPRLPLHMIPDAFTFLPALPRTASGKIDTAAVAASPRSRAVAYVAPRSELESRAADAWQRVLKLERVGIHDNFFDVGGHSLLLVRLLREMRQTLSADLSLSDLFQYPTIGSLADAVHRRTVSPVSG